MAGTSAAPEEGQGRRSPVYWFVGLTILALLAAFLLPAVKQPLDYHNFADHRHAHGIDNFLDVVSNAGFLVFGLMALGSFASGGVLGAYGWAWVLWVSLAPLALAAGALGLARLRAA